MEQLSNQVSNYFCSIKMVGERGGTRKDEVKDQCSTLNSILQTTVLHHIH